MYQPGDTYGIDQTVDNHTLLHAIWTYATDIQFSGNGSDGGEQTKGLIIPANKTQVLPANTYARTDYAFKEWNAVPSPIPENPGVTYADGAEYKSNIAAPTDVTLYAQWKPVNLYRIVQSMVKRDENGDERTQTAANLKEVITRPTFDDSSIDTSNSGVYKYDASTFGTANDASNDYTIYYYRGILDSNLDDTSESSYGSNGDGIYYPNYVRLGNTCWRIVRTTGSGGVKMIYNGPYSTGTTANSCANSQTYAQIAASVYNGGIFTYKQVVRIGYTYNSAFAANTAYTDTIANVFDNNASPSINNTDSTVKDYIENSWFTPTIGSYESKLEPAAGYCNDRTVYDDTSSYAQLDESTNVVTYGESGLDQLNFGSYVRNKITNDAHPLTLSCARNTVDLYTTSAATDGNKQLSHPAALLTADEAALAGSGGNGRISVATTSSNYSYSSYLRSGYNFWLLSPDARYSFGACGEFYLRSDGPISTTGVNNTLGVRPTISLNHETTVTSGSGTATDPWLIDE